MKLIVSNNANKADVANLSKELGVSENFATLLINRGFNTAEAARKFLYADYSDVAEPYVYSGMSEAVCIIKKHIETRGKILIYGDYDCDGVCAVSLLLRTFRKNNVNCAYYIPTRQQEGYGLNKNALLRIKQEISPSLIITVDCGITAKEETAYVKELGMEIIVTDHHTVTGDLPQCTVIDPVLNEGTTPLCGTGVAYTLVRALFGENTAKELIDICAVATIADIVPLLEDNRILVSYGLKLIQSGRGNIGIDALIKAAGLDRRRITSSDIGFKIAPRLNASGRLGAAHPSVKLLLSDDVTEAKFLAEELSLQNVERQEIGKEIFTEALNMLSGYDFRANRIIVLCSEKWNEGVIGIAAAKITEYFNRPTILLSKGEKGVLKGSARSIGGVNIVELISTQAKLLKGFGGHAMAAGLSLEVEKFDEFSVGINREAQRYSESIFKKNLFAEMDVSVDKLETVFLKELDLLAPYGYKNPAPVFCDTEPKINFSRIGISNHLKAKMKSLEAVFFSGYSELCAYNNASEKQILYSLSKNYFNGAVTNQVNVKKMIYRNFSVALDTLFLNFALFSLDAKNNKRKTRLPVKRRYIALDVFFDGKLFADFIEKNTEVLQYYYSCDSFEFENSAVLSPSINFPFGLFSQIRVHGKITDDMKVYFDAFNAEYTDSGAEVNLDTNFSIDEMREVYKCLRKYSGTRFKGIEDIYKCAKNYLSTENYEIFAIYFAILSDIELINIGCDGILNVNNFKIDINSSAIYRYING